MSDQATEATSESDLQGVYAELTQKIYEDADAFGAKSAASLFAATRGVPTKSDIDETCAIITAGFVGGMRWKGFPDPVATLPARWVEKSFRREVEKFLNDPTLGTAH